MQLTDDQCSDWERDGWLLLPQAIEPPTLQQLTRAVDDVTEWAHHGGPGLHHVEQTDRGVALARSERFADHHRLLDDFLRDGLLPAVLERLFGEPAVLFKEKINYKHPGGGGFAPHQDATAYRFVDHHISVMVPIDPATVASGCLHVAPGHDRGRLPTDARGRIDEATAAALDWRPVEVEPGDLVVFDSYTPHYSETNTTDRPRRAYYLTYNAATQGDHRSAYYADKQAEFDREGDSFDGRRARISISDDFLGRPVEQSPSIPADALHERSAADAILALLSSDDAQMLYDEVVTEREHAEQCAAWAVRQGAPPHLVAAALCHDLGHILLRDHRPIEAELDRDAHHERAGARFLARWYGPDITEPVGLHVAAKRYLCASDPAYRAELSPSSERSLAVQGGVMTDAEMREFEANPHFDAALAVRRWDDLGKAEGRSVPGADSYRGLLEALLATHGRAC